MYVSEATNTQALHLWNAMHQRGEHLAGAMLADLMHFLTKGSLAELRQICELNSRLNPGLGTVDPLVWERLQEEEDRAKIPTQTN